MDEPGSTRSEPSTLKDLDARLKAARERQGLSDGARRAAQPSTALGQAWALAIEMAAALAVGAGIGFGLDSWLGTKPWFLIGFLILGLASGVWTAVKKAMRLGAAAEAADRNGGER
jgi:ATP synthase protein I